MSQRFDDEQLLEWILDGKSSDQAAGEQLDEGSRQRMGELTTFLERCRDLADEMEFEETAPLAQEVLARTTREDLSWRGDLALVGRYLRERVSSSGWMKLAAASLLVHMIALPALAYYVFVAQPEASHIEFIDWDDYYPESFSDHEEQPTPELDYPEEDGDELEGLVEDQDR